MLDKSIRSVIELIRPYNALPALFSFAIGYFWFSKTTEFSFWLTLLTLFLTHSAATVQNDINDYPIDKINDPERIIHLKNLTVKTAKLVGYCLTLGAFLLSLLNKQLFVITLTGIFLSWLYNYPPFYFSRKPILSLIILGLVYTVLPMTLGFIIKNIWQLNIRLVFFIFFWFLLRFSTAILKDFKDIKGDSLHQKNTFLLIYGKTLVDGISIIGTSIAYVGIFSFIISRKPWQPIIAILIIFMIYSLYKRWQIVKSNDTFQAKKLFPLIFMVENRLQLFFLLYLFFL